MVLGLEGGRSDQLRRRWSLRDDETWRFRSEVLRPEGFRRFGTWRMQKLREEGGPPQDREMMPWWICQDKVAIPLVELDGLFGDLSNNLL